MPEIKVRWVEEVTFEKTVDGDSPIAIALGIKDGTINRDDGVMVSRDVPHHLSDAVDARWADRWESDERT